MKQAIITRADETVKEWAELTHPLFQQYAKKCRADFIVLSSPAPFLDLDNQPHYRLLEVYRLLETYDRILHLDTDMIINKGCPNIFDLVPENMVGSIYEDVGTRATDRQQRIGFIQSLWGDVGWKTGYTNAGTFLMSREHKNIFLPHENKYWVGTGTADLHMSYNIHKYGFKVFELDYKWNHMTMFSEEWNDNADRFDSHIIHYAGRGVFDANVKDKDEQAALDYARIYS